MTQRREENTPLRQESNGLQFDPIAFSSGGGPPRLAGARRESAGTFIKSDFECRNTRSGRC